MPSALGEHRRQHIVTTAAREVRPAVATGTWTSSDPGAIGQRFGGLDAFPARPREYRLDAEFVSTPAATIEWFSHRDDVVLEHGDADRQAFGVFGDRHGELLVGGLRVGARSVVADNPEPRVYRLTGRNDYAVVILQGEVVDVGDLTLIDLEASSAKYERLATSLAQTRRLARSGGSSPSALAAASEGVVDALYSIVHDAVPVGPTCDLDAADVIVMEAVAAIREERAASITELTRAVSASRSSLYRSFDAVLGISPYAYMQQRRLLQLRRRLLAVDDEPGVVTREAANLGAFHLGHLASSYRKLFGESPRETVRRKPVDPSAPEVDDAPDGSFRRCRSWAV